MKRKGLNSAILGLLAFIFSYAFSYMNNTWQLSLFRAGIGFLFFFILGFIVLNVLDQLISSKEEGLPNTEESLANKAGSLEMKQETLAEEQVEEENFQSIPLQSLHNEDKREPSEEAIIQATRSWMTGDRGDSQ